MTTTHEVRLSRGESPTCNTIGVGPFAFVISYQTVVAFAVAGEGWTVCENVWSKTTGKHLNQAVGFIAKEARIPRAEFERRLERLFARIEIRPLPPMSPGDAERYLQEA